MADSKTPERPRRQRVLKGAAILRTINDSEIRCTIRNMSAGGAEFRVTADTAVPEKFLLYVPVDGVAYRAEMLWRSGERIGVKFTGTEPKPHWHYG